MEERGNISGATIKEGGAPLNSLRRFHSPSKVTQHSLQRGIERPFSSTEDQCIREATHPPVRATIILHVETILTPAPPEDPALHAAAVMDQSESMKGKRI